MSPEISSLTTSEISPVSCESLSITTTDGTSVTVHDLRERFFQSKYGLAMADQELRYAVNFGYDRDRMIADLGNDLNPVGHQYDLPLFLDLIVTRERHDASLFGSISDDELAVLGFACAIHDIGESEHPNLLEHGLTPVGDLPSGTKTDTDRANEAAVREFFYHNFYDDVPSDVIARVEAIVSHNDDTLLHDLYEAAHELQTFDTGTRASIRLFEAYHGRGEPLLTEQKLCLEALETIVRKQAQDKLSSTAFIGVRSVVNTPPTSQHRVTIENADFHARCVPPNPVLSSNQLAG